MEVLHRCDNKMCCNPAHLFVGSQKDNIHDAIGKGRNSRGEHHPGAKLKPAGVVEIRRLRNDLHLPLKEIASRFGVTDSLVSHIATGKIWKHIPLSGRKVSIP
jgi:DNA-binding transcriptional regulator YiaG